MGWLEAGGDLEVGMTVKIGARVQPDGFPVVVFTK